MYRALNLLAIIATILWSIFSPSFEPFIILIMAVATLFRDEIHGVIGANLVSLTPKSSLVKNLKNFKFSFTEPNYINPRIIEELNGLISDSGNTTISINLIDANDSNQFYLENITFKQTDNYPIISYEEDEGYFCYQYIGYSFTGVHLIRTWVNYGGTGVFESIIFITISNDYSIEYEEKKFTKTQRLIIKKIGSIPLGDNYTGEIKFKFGILTIPACSGHTPNPIRNKKLFLLIL